VKYVKKVITKISK